MLQQTQVATVLPYYEAWMAAWPTVESLAAAQLHNVHKCWAGLGYYSRATRLHLSAQKVCSTLGGKLPTTAAALQSQLSGVGRYTAAAVASIACGEAVAVVDGNVTRVVARLRAIGADVVDKRTVDTLWKLAEELLDSRRPGDANQALMELGATVCTPKKPQCSSCPVRSCCLAYSSASVGARDIPRTSVLNHFTSNTEAVTPLGGSARGKWETARDVADGNSVLRKGSPREGISPRGLRSQTNLDRVSRSADGSQTEKIPITEGNLGAVSPENVLTNNETRNLKEPNYKSMDVSEQEGGHDAGETLPVEMTTDLRPLGDIEDECWLCLPLSLRDLTLGVQNYPRKGRKTSSRRQTSAVVVLQCCTGDRREESTSPQLGARPLKRPRTSPRGGGAPQEDLQLLTLQRPSSGLLASLWELPSIDVTTSEDLVSLTPASLLAPLCDLLSLPPQTVTDLRFVDDVVHVFSHIHQTYKVYVGTLTGCPPLPVPATHRAIAYMTAHRFLSSAVSTAMKKVLKKAMSHWEKQESIDVSAKTARRTKQTKLLQYFTR